MRLLGTFFDDNSEIGLTLGAETLGFPEESQSLLTQYTEHLREMYASGEVTQTT